MKPHIKLLAAVDLRIWCCVGSGTRAYGNSPSEAYRRWRVSADIKRHQREIGPVSMVQMTQASGAGISRV